MLCPRLHILLPGGFFRPVPVLSCFVFAIPSSLVYLIKSINRFIPLVVYVCPFSLRPPPPPPRPVFSTRGFFLVSFCFINLVYACALWNCFRRLPLLFYCFPLIIFPGRANLFNGRPLGRFRCVCVSFQSLSKPS